MPTLADPTAASLVRMLLVGDSGSGKTGGLASLVKAGYKLWIADYDNGMEILKNLLIKMARDEKKPDMFYASRVDYETCKDPYTIEGNLVIPKEAIAWAKGVKYMNSVFQRPVGADDIAVMDSLSFAARMAMNYHLKINNRLKSPPWPADWNEAQGHVVRLVDMMTGGAPCHLICTAHIAYTGGKEKVSIKQADGSTKTEIIDHGPEKGLPAMVGKAINPIIGRFFNHTLLFRQVGAGSLVSRKIHTTTFENIELKNTNPGVIKPDYPLATGLADYFRDARGTEPSQAKAA